VKDRSDIRRGRRGKKILDKHKEEKGCWKLKEEAVDRTLWSTHFGRCYGPFVRQKRGGCPSLLEEKFWNFLFF
jgi:hypothetical protein